MDNLYPYLREQELDSIRQSIKSDEVYRQRLGVLYDRINEDITRDIVNDIEKFAYKNNLSMTEASKLVSKVDVKNYDNKVKEYIKNKDFSSIANRELSKYNVTLRTNRLELLQARINLSTVELANEEDKMLREHLFKDIAKEYERQAGILGITVPSPERLSKMFRAVILTDVSGITFSHRIWANQAELRDEINNTIRRVIIRGENPRKAGRDLRKYVKDYMENKKYNADRLAITESARGQIKVQELTFTEYDIGEYMYIAETDDRTCAVCANMDGMVYKTRDLLMGVNAPPMHPLCRCSIAGHIERN